MASAAPTVTSKRPSLTRRDFFHDVADALRPLLPTELGEVHIRNSFNLLKVYFGHHRLHYEVWANARDRHIEVGLHFEDGPESTEHLLRFFDRHIVEIKHELGPEIELERWTRSWGHLYLHLPYQPLTEELARQIATRLAHLIVTLQPLLCEADRRARGR